MNKKSIILIVGITMLALVISSCSVTGGVTSTASNSEGDVKEFYIDSYNWDFSESGQEINVGDSVRLIVTSSEGVHGIAIPELGIATGAIAPGQEEIIEFVATKAGTYPYYCNIACGPGHMSMRNSIVIN